MNELNIINALQKNNYHVKFFHTKKEAGDYLCSQLEGQTIGFGDSITITQMELFERLSEKNTVYDPNHTDTYEDFLDVAEKCLTTDCFITSVNAISEDGVLVNMDGTGNRIAGSMFRHKTVFFVVGKNKITPDVESAVYRVRNIAAPLNAKRLNLKTPCARTGKCHDCRSPERICNGLFIQLKAMMDIESVVILIDEVLGY